MELAEKSQWEMEIDENKLPILENVKGASELLGLDPIHIANEGRFIAFVPKEEADRACSILKSCRESEGAVKIGEVKESKGGKVWLKGIFGQIRLLDMLSGEQLPRIC